MRKSQNPLVVCVIVAMNLCSISVAVGDTSDPLRMSAISSACRERFIGIESIEYKSVVKSAGDSPIRQQFMYQRGQFRSMLDSPESKTHFHKEAAFDGKLFQELDPSTSTLTVSRAQKRGAAYLAMEAATTPYMFALPPKSVERLKIETFQDTHVWEDLFKRAVSKGTRRIDGHDCEILQFEWPKPDGPGVVIWEVAFAQDQAWSPIQVVARIDDRFASILRMTNVEVADPRGVRRYLPIRIAIAQGKPNGDVTENVTILEVEESSIRLNRPIEDEVFSIPRGQAAIFVDVDLHASTHVGGLENLESVADLPATVPADPDLSSEPSRGRIVDSGNSRFADAAVPNSQVDGQRAGLWLGWAMPILSVLLCSAGVVCVAILYRRSHGKGR